LASVQDEEIYQSGFTVDTKDTVGAGDAFPGVAADFGRIAVGGCDDVEAVAVEASVVGEGHAEVAGAGDDDVTRAVQAERGDELFLETRDVVPDAARAELPARRGEST